MTSLQPDEFLVPLSEKTYRKPLSCESPGPSGFASCDWIRSALSHWQQFMDLAVQPRHAKGARDVFPPLRRIRLTVGCRVCGRRKTWFAHSGRLTPLLLLLRNLAVLQLSAKDSGADISTSLELETTPWKRGTGGLTELEQVSKQMELAGLLSKDSKTQRRV